MKNLNINIQKNKHLFDDEDMPTGHLERFEALLDEQKAKTLKTVRHTRRIRIWSFAASIIILITGGCYFFSINKNQKVEIGTSISSSEFDMANNFYRQQMDEQISDIMCKLDNADLDTRAELGRDIESMVDENETFIEEIKKNEDQEIAIHYMVEHYKMKIDALEFINEKLGNYINC